MADLVMACRERCSVDAARRVVGDVAQAGHHHAIAGMVADRVVQVGLVVDAAPTEVEVGGSVPSIYRLIPLSGGPPDGGGRRQHFVVLGRTRCGRGWATRRPQAALFARLPEIEAEHLP